MKNLFLIIIFLGVYSNGNSQIDEKIDTLVFYTNNYDQPRLPGRGSSTEIDINTFKKTVYIDSIKFQQNVINKGFQYYYLQIFDIDSTLRLKGLFFDFYPCDTLWTFTENSDTLSVGRYKLSKYKKPVTVLKDKDTKKIKSTKWYYTHYTVKIDRWVYYDHKRNTKTIEFYNVDKRIKTVKTYNRNNKLILDKEEKIKQSTPYYVI